MKADSQSTIQAQGMGEIAKFPDEIPAHLAFRQIVVHEVSESAPHQFRVNFHFREHSKHIRRSD